MGGKERGQCKNPRNTWLKRQTKGGWQKKVRENDMEMEEMSLQTPFMKVYNCFTWCTMQPMVGWQVDA